MAVLSITNPTLADAAKVTDPDGKMNIANIVDILAQTNEALDDMTWIEGNLPTGHRTSISTGIPAPTWRKLYGGVQPNKSTHAQITDNCGMMEAYAEVDKALADLNGNSATFRLIEDMRHIEGMSQEMAQTLFYGNEGTEPEAFTGIAPRFNSLSAANADNIIDAGGTSTDNTSVFLVVWGPQTCHGIYPKGSMAGLQSRDMGEVTIENADGNGGRMQAYRSHYKWDAGLCVKDWRYIVRVCNIDVSDLRALTGTQAVTAATNILKMMTRASERVQSTGIGRPVFYVNRTVRENLRMSIIEKITSNLTWETVAGKRVMTFDDIPVRRVDQLLLTEARVV